MSLADFERQVISEDTPRETHGDKITEFLTYNRGERFKASEIGRDLGIAGGGLYTVFQRLHETGAIFKEGKYYYIPAEAKNCDPFEMAANAFNIDFPLEIGNYARVAQGDVVLVAGTKNSGKSAFLAETLPLRILYVFSDLLYLVLYYLPSYRRKVVRTNLKNSFPEKTEKELISIEKKFYKHLADLFIETFKLTHMSKAQQMKRCTISNTQILDKLLEGKRDVVAILGHYNNWEWLNILPLYTRYKTVSIYKPLQNNYFNDFTNALRSKFGMVLTPMSIIIREIINDRINKINTLSSFLSDQTPVKSEIKYWTTFLNQDTPVYLGAEKVAKKYDMAVIYFHIQKIKRGYYNLNIELLFDHTAGLPDHLITETHVRRLEEIIKEKPEYWIWSHRRWKHKKPVENE